MDISQKFGKELSTRLFRRQGFTTMPLNIWNPGAYLISCSQLYSIDYPILLILDKLGLSKKFYLGSDYYGLMESIALFIYDIFKFEDVDREFESIISVLGIDKSSIENTISNLKESILSEVRNNREEYESFIRSDDISNQVVLFEQNGEISTEFLGCLLQLSSNLLNVVIVLIPLCYGMPFLPIIPAHGSATKYLLYLFYNPLQNSFTLLIDNNLSKLDTKCKCGKKDKIAKGRCISDPRCSCFKRGVSCSKLCKCKGCLNNKIIDAKAQRRKRIQPVLSQDQPLSSLSAAVLSGDIPVDTGISYSQHFFFGIFTLHVFARYQS